MSDDLRCPKCNSIIANAGKFGNLFMCSSIFYHDGKSNREGIQCIASQRDQLKAALTALMPFVLEDYHEDCAEPEYKSAVETAKRLIE